MPLNQEHTTARALRRRAPSRSHFRPYASARNPRTVSAIKREQKLRIRFVQICSQKLKVHLLPCACAHRSNAEALQQPCLFRCLTAGLPIMGHNNPGCEESSSASRTQRFFTRWKGNSKKPLVGNTSGTGACLSRPSSPASRSSRARVAGVGGTSGKRRWSVQKPIRLSTVFTGPGFDSQKLASKEPGVAPLQLARLSPVVAKAASRIMRVTSAGASLEATLMSPCAPTPMAASARLSSPEKILKPRGSDVRPARQTAAACRWLP